MMDFNTSEQPQLKTGTSRDVSVDPCHPFRTFHFLNWLCKASLKQALETQLTWNLFRKH